MAQHIHHCNSCKIYTLEQKCPQCEIKTIQPKPPKFSLTDKYAGYRRKVKIKELKEKNLY